MVSLQFRVFLVVVVFFFAAAHVEGKLRVLRGGKTAQEWQGRRIYQLLTDRFALSPGGQQTCSNMNEYCGGTFAGITNHLDYIAGMGFNAIWISPVIANTPGGYHGYWAQNFFQINSNFGTNTDLLTLVNSAHSKGIWVMVDIVVNHVGPVGTDFSTIQPFNDSSYYHQNCDINGYVCLTQEVEVCRLASLPDLDQNNNFVAQTLIKYVNWLMDTFQFDGIRADTVMYINQGYWNQLQTSVGAFIAGEVWSDFNCNLQYTNYGVDATLNYPLFNAIRSVYQQAQPMGGLGDAWNQQLTMKQPTWEVNFIDNHDNDRWLVANGNIPLYKSALAHMFFTTGVPCVYYGTEQEFSGTIAGNECRQPLWPSNYNTNADMYNFLKTLNQAYDQLNITDQPVKERWRDNSMYCFLRGMLLLCTTNTQNQQTRTLLLLPFQGMSVCDYFNQNNCQSGGATMTITIPGGGNPLLLFGKQSS